MTETTVVDSGLSVNEVGKAEIKKAFKTISGLLVAWQSHINTTAVGELIKNAAFLPTSEEQQKTAIDLARRFYVKASTNSVYIKLFRNRFIIAEVLAGNQKTIKSAVEMTQAVQSWLNLDPGRYFDAKQLATAFKRNDIYQLANVELMSTSVITDTLDSACDKLIGMLIDKMEK